VRARESIKTFDQSDFGDSIEEKNRAADVLRSLFTANASQIGDLYFANIRDAFAIRHKESVTADEKCDLYCAAAALQTLVDIWDEAANLMKDLALVPREDTALGFEFLGIEELVTVVDVAAPRHRTILLTWSLPSPTAS
jgi:hypothetical protein